MLNIIRDDHHCQEISVSRITDEVALAYVIGYCTVSGRISKLIYTEDIGWRFINVFNAMPARNSYECRTFPDAHSAVQAIATKKSTRDLKMFTTDLEFATWSVDKLTKYGATK